MAEGQDQEAGIRKLNKKGNSAVGETYTPPPDLSDIDELWVRSDQGDPLTTPTLSKIPVGKPRDFFRTVPDRTYREKTEIYIHKTENTIDETAYIIGPALRGQIEEG